MILRNIHSYKLVYQVLNNWPDFVQPIMIRIIGIKLPVVSRVQGLKNALKSVLGHDTIEDRSFEEGICTPVKCNLKFTIPINSDRAANCFISALFVSNHSLALLCGGKLGLFLLYLAGYKFVCSTRMSKNVRNKFRWHLYPRVPVKGEPLGSLSTESQSASIIN